MKETILSIALVERRDGDEFAAIRDQESANQLTFGWISVIDPIVYEYV